MVKSDSSRNSRNKYHCTKFRESRVPLKPVLGYVAGVAHVITGHEPTQ